MAEIKNEKTKKGMLSTLSIFLLASSLLMLLLSISLYSNSLKNDAVSSTSLDDINAYYDSVAYGAAEVVKRESVNVTANRTYLIFQVNLSTPLSYTTDINRFWQFMQTNSTVNVTTALVNTTIRFIEMQRPTLYILPYNISVNHTNRRATFEPYNRTASWKDIKGYNITIRVGFPAVTNVSWKPLFTVPASSPDALNISVNVTGTNGSRFESRILNRSRFNSLRMIRRLGTSTTYNITINFSQSAISSLAIGYNISMYLKTIVLFDTNTSVEFGNNTINVSIPGLGEKIGKVIVVES